LKDESTPGITGQGVKRPGVRRLIPIADAADAFSSSVATLKRLYFKECLPVVRIGRRWLVPEDFYDAVISAIGPGRAAVVEDIGREWFAVREAPYADKAA
jgi:hypothetical protein